MTFKHLGYLNYIFSWCAITTLGSYDYKKGGHLILWDLGLVIEFPPGATILIPSAYMTHSNIAITSGETQYSFTQYTASSLFHFIDEGLQTQKGMSKEERTEVMAQAQARVTEGLNLYSTLDQLHPLK